MRLGTRRLSIIILFGVVIFLTKAVIPSPFNKMLIGAQALMLALGAILLGNMGGTLVSFVGGVLTALSNIALAPFTLFFAVLYGLLVDASFSILNIKAVCGEVEAVRVSAAMTISTSLVGFASYYLTVHMMGLLPRSLPLEVMILVLGAFSGAVAGYFASFISNNHLRSVKL